MSVKGMVFDIERYAIEDGPGIRTLVFLKGCPLRCLWCANPESHHSKPDIMYFINKCTNCGRCLRQCPPSAIKNMEGFGLVTDPLKCDGCGQCVDHCFYDARQQSGKEMTVDEVMSVVRRDVDFYHKSGGGVTFSGGEPFLQKDFLQALVARCREEDLSTAVETCGYVPWQNIEPVLPFLDLVFFDIKHTDAQRHFQFTGADNLRILDNLRKINSCHEHIIVRVPCIPGFNNDIPTFERIFRLTVPLQHVKRIEVLPYHRLGSVKYKALGKRYQLEHLQPVHKGELAHLADLGRQWGLDVSIGAK